MSENIIIIDLGEKYIKYIYSENKKILWAEKKEINCIQNQVIINFDEFHTEIKNIYHFLEKKFFKPIEKIILLISSLENTFQNHKHSVEIDGVVKKSDIKSLEYRFIINNQEKEETIHLIENSYEVDEIKNIINPNNIMGNTLSQNKKFFTMGSLLYKNIVKIFKSLDINVEIYRGEPFVINEIFEKNFIYFDLGYNYSRYYIIKNQKIQNYREINRGLCFLRLELKNNFNLSHDNISFFSNNKQLNDLCKDFFINLLKPVITKEQVVYLGGGCVTIPFLEQLLSDYFHRDFRIHYFANHFKFKENPTIFNNCLGFLKTL